MQISCTTKRLQLLALLVAGAVVVVVLMILFFFNYPTLARERIIEAVVFKNGTEAMDRFQSTKGITNLRLSFYVFNITNSRDFIKGKSKLNLNELGPYVYDEYKEKRLVDNNQTTGLISFKLLTRYKFNRELSIGDPSSATIIWPNVPLIVAQSKVNSISNYLTRTVAMQFLNLEIARFKEPAFIADTVQNFIMNGSKREFFAHLETLPGVEDYLNPWPLKDNKFGLLYGKNFTWDPLTDHIFSASAGFGLNQTSADLNRFVKIDNSPTMQFWQPQPPHCNLMDGTDGQFFSPFLEQPSDLTVYSTELCRKLSFKFVQNSYVNGVPALKYVLDEQSFQNGQKNPENQCYCLERYDNGSAKPVCDLDGLIDMSKCNNPCVVGSGAHFMAGSPELVNRLTGLTAPNISIHQPTIYVEPNTGLTIKVKVPVQFNVRLESLGFFLFEFYKNNEPLHIPLVWASETSDLNDSQASELKSKLLLLDSWLVTMVLGATIVLLLGIPVIGFIICCRYRRSSTDPTETDPLLH